MDEQPRLGDPTDMTEQVLAGGAGGLAQRMEIELVLCSSARVVARMPVEGNTQPYGLLHGGASVVLAETLGSIGSAIHAGPGRIAVGVDINATHHRAARSGWVTGTAIPVTLGGSVACYEVTITDDEGNEIDYDYSSGEWADSEKAESSADDSGSEEDADSGDNR